MTSSVLNDLTQTAPTVKINGTALDTAWKTNLVSLRVNRGLSMTARTTLRFFDFGYELAASKKVELGSLVDVAIGTQTVFKGAVTGVSIEHSSSARTQELVITADDHSFRLGLSYVTKSYEKSSAGDVIKQIAARHGLSPTLCADINEIVHDYLLQNGSDLAFVEALTRRANCVWWVDDKTLVVKPASQSEGVPLMLTLLEDLLDFSVRATGLRPTEVKVGGWDPAQVQKINGASGWSSSKQQAPDSPIATKFVGKAPATPFGTATLEFGGANPNTQREAQILATSMDTMLNSEAITARGTTYVNNKVKPYTKVTISGGGPSDGSYVVSEVEHLYSSRGFFTKFVAGPARPSLLVDTIGRQQTDPGFTVPGLVTGVVSDVGKDATLGQVKIKYSGIDDQLVSAWARVATPGGGKNRGSVFLPEVGDEVLVGFERGDTRHPVVIGGLFSSQIGIAADGSVVKDGKIAYRRITSRSGHVIELADGDDDANKYISLQLADKAHQIRIGADRGDIKMPSGKPFAITIGDAKIEIDGSGNVTIDCASLTVKTKQAIEMSAKTGFKVASDTQLSLQAKVSAEVKADATLTLQASGQAALKGGVVMIN